MDKYTPIVTAYGQIYADSDSQNELKIWKSRILNVRRRAPHQNESFFIKNSDFQRPGGSNPWTMHIFIKSLRAWKKPRFNYIYEMAFEIKIMTPRHPHDQGPRA